jgi:hypothetical protein
VISHAHRLIYIHQRKTAGVSMMAAMGMTPADSDWHLYNNGVLAPGWAERTEAERGYFVFSTVRNPFDRLVSGWKYLKSTRERTLIDVLRAPPLEGVDYRHLTRPQIAILRDPASGTLVTHALLRYETLQADFNALCDRLGLPRRDMPLKNAGVRERDYRSYFDAETRQLAEAMFAEDLAAFGYGF